MNNSGDIRNFIDIVNGKPNTKKSILSESIITEDNDDWLNDDDVHYVVGGPNAHQSVIKIRLTEHYLFKLDRYTGWANVFMKILRFMADNTMNCYLILENDYPQMLLGTRFGKVVDIIDVNRRKRSNIPYEFLDIFEKFMEKENLKLSGKLQKLLNK